MKTYNKIMEFFWMGLSIVTLMIALYYLVVGGWAKYNFYLVFPAICLLMYVARRYMRRRMEKHIKWMEENDKQTNSN